MCFIDLSKAFDRVRLNCITTLLRQSNVSLIVKTIENMNTNTTTRILVNKSLTPRGVCINKNKTGKLCGRYSLT